MREGGELLAHLWGALCKQDAPYSGSPSPPGLAQSLCTPFADSPLGVLLRMTFSVIWKGVR